MISEMQTPVKTKVVELPKRKNHKTPRLIAIDAYTFGSNDFESARAKHKSIYYLTFRRRPYDFNPDVFEKGDDRYVFYGLQKILDYLFYEPVTHEEIDEAVRFAKDKKINSKGELVKYNFPEIMWRRVVDEFNGRPPIEIKALKEGSVFYPNEPIVQVTSQVDGMGVLAAWFESKTIQLWSTSMRVTQNEHWFLYCKSVVRQVLKTAPDDKIDFYARLMMPHDFGDRAGMNHLESEMLGEAHLLTSFGTDTFAGLYQAWKNSGEATGVGFSVSAMAHRNVQSFENEKDSFKALYNSLEDNEIGSFIADCYSFFDAVENYLIPLAKKSETENNGKIVVGRSDSGNSVENITWMCRTAVKHGLFTEEKIDGVFWRIPTFFKTLESNGMTWVQMKKVIEALLEQGFPPFFWTLFGVGGGLRRIERDDPSAKYALCAVGDEDIPVCKFSEELGKTTLPGPFALSRNKEHLENKQTIFFEHEREILKFEDCLIEYFNGSRKEKPFGIGQDDDFLQIRARIKEQMATMPKSLETVENHNYPASESVLQTRRTLLKKYAPKKLEKNY